MAGLKETFPTAGLHADAMAILRSRPRALMGAMAIPLDTGATKLHKRQNLLKFMKFFWRPGCATTPIRAISANERDWVGRFLCLIRPDGKFCLLTALCHQAVAIQQREQ